MSSWFTGCVVAAALAASSGESLHQGNPGKTTELAAPPLLNLGQARRGPLGPCQGGKPQIAENWLPVEVLGGGDQPVVVELCQADDSGFRCIPLGRVASGEFQPTMTLLQGAPDAVTLPRRPTAINHLQQAIEHLKSGGFLEEAHLLERRLDEARQSQRTELESKRRQLEELRCEIAELEEELGVGNQYLLNLIIGEVDVAKLRETGIGISCFSQWAGKDAVRPVQSGKEDSASPGTEILKSADFHQMLETLLAIEAVTIDARPSLVTQAGKPAQLRSGGEFPIVIPQPDGSSTTSFKEFGLTVNAVVQPLTDKRIRLKVSPEVSHRDYRSAVRINDVNIPGLATRRAHSETELSLGQTVILAMTSNTLDGKESIWFVACTPEKFTLPQETQSPGVRLVPIPEAYRQHSAPKEEYR